MEQQEVKRKEREKKAATFTRGMKKVFENVRSQQRFTCEKSKIEALKMLKMFKVKNNDITTTLKFFCMFQDDNKDTRTTVNGVVLISLLLTLNIFHTFSGVSIVYF